MFVAETASVAQAVPTGVEGLQSQSTAGLMNRLVEEGMRLPLPRLPRGPLSAGIGQIYEENRNVFVLFSVVNDSKQPMELLPPQVQLAGYGRKGRGSVVQLPVKEYRLSRRRIAPHERADGVVQFEKPAFKQSHESYLLQIAESSAVDRPRLISIQVGSGQALKESEER